jgi:hypothetical protein
VAKKKLPPGFDNQNKAVNQYEERRSYKNISIYVTDLPATPTRFRDKYHRGYTPEQSHSHHPEVGPHLSRSDLIKIAASDSTISASASNSTPSSSLLHTPPRVHIFQTECSQLKIVMFHVGGFLVGDTIRVVVDTIIAPERI